MYGGRVKDFGFLVAKIETFQVIFYKKNENVNNKSKNNGPLQTLPTLHSLKEKKNEKKNWTKKKLKKKFWKKKLKKKKKKKKKQKKIKKPKSNCIHMFNVTYYSTDVNKSLMKEVKPFST